MLSYTEAKRIALSRGWVVYRVERTQEAGRATLGYTVRDSDMGEYTLHGLRHVPLLTRAEAADHQQNRMSPQRTLTLARP